MDSTDLLAKISKDLQTLICQSTREEPLEEGLKEVGGFAVRCYRTQPGAIAALGSGVDRPNGTVFKGDDAYHVFIDSSIDQQAPVLLGAWGADRFLVLHEYGHALHGDLPEDRFTSQRVVDENRLYPGECDAAADGYALERLERELLSRGLAREADAAACQTVREYGPILRPTEPAYEEWLAHWKQVRQQ